MTEEKQTPPSLRGPSSTTNNRQSSMFRFNTRTQSTLFNSDVGLTRFFSRKFNKAPTQEDDLNSSTAEGASTTGTAKDNKDTPPSAPVKALTLWELLVVLRPFFWPAEGTDGATINRIRAIGTWIMVAGSKTCSLINPLFLQIAVNEFISGNKEKAFAAMSISVMLRLATSILKESQSMLYIKVNQQAAIELQEYTFSHLHSLSLNWHISKKTGNVVRVMDRGKDAANTLVTYVFLYLIPALAECLAVVILFFAQYNQFTIGVLILGAVVLYCISTVRITLWRNKQREKTNTHDNDFHSKCTDSILNYETVKYFTNEDYETARFRQSVAKYQKYNASTQFSLSFLNISQQVVLNATVLGTALIAGQQVIDGKLSIGEWVALQAWVNQIFVPLNFLGSVYGAIVQALVDIKNLSELFAAQPDVSDTPGAVAIPLSIDNLHSYERSKLDATLLVDDVLVDIEQPPANIASKQGGVSVEFKDIYFHYPSQDSDKGLQGVNIRVQAGTTTAIVGHTGAGKTTISRLLFRFYDPQQGSVLLDGFDIKKYTQKSVRRAIGVVPQDTVLFNDTILHNIRYGRMDATMDEIEKAAEAAHIRGFIESLPDKWETTVGERGLKLSGGEKQRVAIARCLLKNPPVVLLDEATSALDTVTESSIQDALWALGKNRTVLIIAHRLSTIKQADQIIVLDAGQVAEVGSHEELLLRNGLYSKLWSMQLRHNIEGEDENGEGVGDEEKGEGEEETEGSISVIGKSKVKAGETNTV